MCQIMSGGIYGECQRNTHSKPESMPILLEAVRLSVESELCEMVNKNVFRRAIFSL